MARGKSTTVANTSETPRASRRDFSTNRRANGDGSLAARCMILASDFPHKQSARQRNGVPEFYWRLIGNSWCQTTWIKKFDGRSGVDYGVAKWLILVV